MDRREGSSTVLVMAAVLFLSAAAVGALAMLGSSALLIRRASAAGEDHVKLDAEARTVLDKLGDRTAVDVDSPFDPVWTYVAGMKDGAVKVTLEDVSSRLNLNTVRTEIFDRTELGSLLSLGHSSMELRQYRADKGPFPTLSAYDGFFPPAVLERNFTVYGYINVNTTFENELEDLFAARTGDKAAAAAFRGAARSFLAKREMITKEQLPVLFGLYSPQLSPLMNVEPQMNVNFIPPEILLAILSYPYGGRKIDNAQGVCSAILSDRQGRGLTPQYLSDLIHAKGEQLLVFQYLGTRTWFWRITVTEGGRSVQWVAARLPDGGRVRFAVLEDRFQ